MMEKGKLTFKGICRVEAKGAYPESLLNACAVNALEIWDMRCLDAYTLTFCIYERDEAMLRTLAEKTMCDVKLETVGGGSRLKNFAKRHVVFFAGAIVILMLLVLSSFFIWDMEVYGNDKLSDGEILRALADCGVDCGTFWPGMDKELLRSEMLLRLPELAWMTVNVNSSRASVVVSERLEKPEIYVESDSADLIAKNTGIIKNISALNGKLMVEAGQAVTEGEVLVSGIMDSISSEPRFVRAQGEVIAGTWHEKHSVSPSEQAGKKPSAKARLRFAVKLGQKRMNFYIGGRKTVDGCDKNIDNYIIRIKNVFALPLTVVVERITPYESAGSAVNDTDAMAQRLYEQLEKNVDGEILSHSAVSGNRDGLDFVSLRASCLENIAELSEHKALFEKIP